MRTDDRIETWLRAQGVEADVVTLVRADTTGTGKAKRVVVTLTYVAEPGGDPLTYDITDAARVVEFYNNVVA